MYVVEILIELEFVRDKLKKKKGNSIVYRVSRGEVNFYVGRRWKIQGSLIVSDRLLIDCSDVQPRNKWRALSIVESSASVKQVNKLCLNLNRGLRLCRCPVRRTRSDHPCRGLGEPVVWGSVLIGIPDTIFRSIIIHQPILSTFYGPSFK